MGIVGSVLRLGRRGNNRRGDAEYRRIYDQPRFDLTQNQGDRPYMEDATFVNVDPVARKGPTAYFAVSEGFLFTFSVNILDLVLDE